MERIGLNRNFVLSLFNTLFHGFPDYVSNLDKKRDTDKDSCLNAVLFFWFNIEHHFDGKSLENEFKVFLRNNKDWNNPDSKGLLPEQIVETEKESRIIALGYNLTDIPPVSDLLCILTSLYELSLSNDKYKDPYDWDWFKKENDRIFQGSDSTYIGFPTKEQQCKNVFLTLTERETDFEGLSWDYGDMSKAQEQYIEDLKASLSLYKKLSQVFDRIHEHIYNQTVESFRTLNEMRGSGFELQKELAKANNPSPVSDKYTDEELREAWRIILNSPDFHNPKLSVHWKNYPKMMKDWGGLMSDDYVLSLLEQTLDLFREREYQVGTTKACELWIKDLEQPLELLREKAPLYSDYANTRPEAELSREKLTELGKLSNDEIDAFKKAGVLETTTEPQDYYKLSDLYYKAEFFNAYCTGLSSKYKRQQDTPEMQALRMRERQMHWEKMGKYLVNGFKPKTDEQETQAPESFKKSIIIRLRDSGLITASKYQKEDKHFYYYVTEQFTPENIKACLLTDRIKWQTIAEFKAIIPEPYKKESNYTPVPMDATTLQRTAYNKARYKK